MRTIFTSMLIFISALFLQAEIQINIQIINSNQESILIYPPVDGQFLFAARSFHEINKAGELKLKFTSNKPGFCYVFLPLNFNKISWNGVQLYVEPDSEISIVIDSEKPNNSLEISGTNEEVNRLLSILQRPLVDYPEFNQIREEYLQIESLASLLEYLELKQEQEMKHLAKIKTSKAIELLIQNDIKLFYYSIFRIMLFKKGMGRDTLGNFFYKDEWSRVLINNYYNQVFNEDAQSSFWYPDLVSDKFHFKMKRSNSEIKYEQKVPLDYSQTMHKFLNEAEIETLLAKELFAYKRKSSFSERARNIYNVFVNEFPESPFRPYFKEMEDKMQFSISEKLKWQLEKNDFNNFQEVLDRVEKDIVYIDIWATWCGPCIAEFSETNSLQSYLDTRNGKIDMVYLTVDQDDNRNEINQAINYHNLKGIHIKASKTLYSELIDRFGTKSRIGIPRYIIVKKDGTIINSNASRPSNWEILKKELDAALEF